MPFKSVSIPFPSNTPHEAMRVMPQIASFLCLLNLLGQLAKSSTTPLGMTQLIPNRENTIFHISLVTGQWTSKWSVVFPLLLHIQHQSTITIWHLCKLSIFKIFPNADIQRIKKKRPLLVLQVSTNSSMEKIVELWNVTPYIMIYFKASWEEGFQQSLSAPLLINDPE